MAEKINELIRDYQAGKLTRREFMRRAVMLTGSLAAANTLLTHFYRSSASAQVAPGDPAVLWHEVEFAGKAGPVFGYLARPAAPGKFPALVLIHANSGLNDHIRDVARRLAKQGYVTLAPDFLSRHGGTAKVNPKLEGLSNIRELAPWQNVAQDADAGYRYLRGLAGRARQPPRVNRILLGRRDDLLDCNSSTRAQGGGAVLRPQPEPNRAGEKHRGAGDGPLRRKRPRR